MSPGGTAQQHCTNVTRAAVLSHFITDHRCNAMKYALTKAYTLAFHPEASATRWQLRQQFVEVAAKTQQIHNKHSAVPDRFGAFLAMWALKQLAGT
jgi:GMP synthase-like glutamine amidotransferase